jgi:PKD repeat protein
MFSNHNTLTICFLIYSSFLSVASARDPFQQPFDQNSIWNMPIGSEAEYVPAKIQPATAYGMTVDEDLIVLTPEAPPVEIFISNAGWDSNKDRCQIDGGLLFEAPIPKDYIVGPDTWDGSTPNSGLAVLMEDWRTIKQTQPFARCYQGDNGTSRYMFGDEDLYGNGYYGAHGATGLSAIGGAIRVGELVPGAGPIRHALKVNIYAAKNVYYDLQTKGYRWPAKSADGYASGTYGTQGDPVTDCRMGALLALPATLNLEDLGLETEPARLLAQAFQDYGAYLVDDTAWDVYAIITEWSPRGRVTDGFEQAWGFSMSTNSQSTSWAKDMRKIFTNLHVVVNNTAASIGGGGTPRVPLAEPITPNRPPLVRLKVSSTSGEPPLTVEFDASQTTDPENDPISFTWEFGDGNSATGAVVSHTFTNTGIYNVTLSPDDGFPLSKYVKKTVTVQVGAIQQMEGTGMGTPGSRNNRGNTFEKAFDTDLSTYFEGPNADSSWVGMDFGGGVNVITIASAARSGSESRMVGGKFQGANTADFHDAVTIYSIEAKPESGKMNQVIVNDHGVYRYARYIGPARSYSVIAELAFYGTMVSSIKDSSPVPVADFRLEQNYPNPFNPVTSIAYSLNQTHKIRLDVFNIRGQLINTLVNETRLAGLHTAAFDAERLSSGEYLYRLEAGDRSVVKKMLLLR